MKIYFVSILFFFMAGSAVASSCKVGQQQWINGCEARCMAGWNGNKKCSKECFATTPLGYTRVNHRAKVVSQNNGSHTVSTLEAGQSFNYTRNINEAYKDSLDLAIKFQDYAAEAKIRQDMQIALSEVSQINSTHQKVRVSVSAHRHGNWADRKRGWSQVRAELLVKCVAPSNLPQQIKGKYKIRDLRRTTTTNPRRPTMMHMQPAQPIRHMQPAQPIRHMQPRTQ